MQTEIVFDIPQAITLRDKDIESSIQHADRVFEGWSDMAFAKFREFLLTHDEFMLEDFRLWLGDSIPYPDDARAFGAITVKAKNLNLIYHLRYEHTKDKKSHRSPKSVWGKV